MRDSFIKFEIAKPLFCILSYRQGFHKIYEGEVGIVFATYADPKLENNQTLGMM
jgi:hypothetical protein